MDTPHNSPADNEPAQGPTGGGGDGVPPLAGGGAAQDEAKAFWCAPPLPADHPRRADEECCRAGLRVEGGDLRPWHKVLPGGGAGQGGGLGHGEEFGHRGPLLGDRLWSDAQVRRLWTLSSVEEGWWDEFMDTQPYWK